MKKSFRNKLLALTAAGASSILLLSGFDSSLTTEDVVNKGREAFSAQGYMNVDVYGVADLSFDVTSEGQTQSLPIGGSIDGKVMYTAEPFAMNVSLDLAGDASAMGLSGSMDMNVYIVTQEDGSTVTYMKSSAMGDDAWHAAKLPDEQIEELKTTLQNSMNGDLNAVSQSSGIDVTGLMDKMMSAMTLSPEPVAIGDKDCYELSYTIGGDLLNDIITEASKATANAGVDTSVVDTYSQLLSGVQINTVMYYAVDTFAPVYANMDLSASDFSTIGQMVGAMMNMGSSDGQTTPPEIGVTINSLGLNMDYHDEAPVIEVPAEALSAEVVEANTDMSAITGETPMAGS